MRLKSLPRLTRTLAPTLILAPLLAVGNAGCFLQHTPNTNPLANVHSNQPDKALFDIAMADLDKNNFTVARLNLETLLNTYPDSEYLARAKMAIADSWYREGGIEGMAQAEAQYKDFITFFPAMKEASEAQLKVATIHYRQLQKPDRDPTEANRAEAELRTFLINYPDSPLRPQALQMLRDTQEVLAEREYRIGQFYMDRAVGGEYADYRAGQSRLEEVLAKYPLYSQGDVVLDELANSYATTSKLYASAVQFEPIAQSKALYHANSDHDRAQAIADFTGLIERYPASPLAKDAQRQLTALHAPVPKPTAAAIAFNRAEIAGRGKAAKATGVEADLHIAALLNTRPTAEIARADKVGDPPLAEPQIAQAEPPPGLDQLIKSSMEATGAIPTPVPGVDAAVLSANGSASSPPVAPAVAAVPAPAVPAAAPLAFQNVPDKPQGADTPDTNTPQATSGSNDNDPIARHAAAPDNPNLVLTPNEIDLQNREQILAAAVHREVPAPEAQLRANAKKQAEARAKAIAKFKEQLAKAKNTKGTAASTASAAGAAPAPATDNPASAPSPTTDLPSAAPKKSFFSRIWP